MYDTSRHERPWRPPWPSRQPTSRSPPWAVSRKNQEKCARKRKKIGGGSCPPGKCTVFGGGKCPKLGVVNVRILGVVNVRLANDLTPVLRSFPETFLSDIFKSVSLTSLSAITCSSSFFLLLWNETSALLEQLCLSKISFSISISSFRAISSRFLASTSVFTVANFFSPFFFLSLFLKKCSRSAFLLHRLFSRNVD